MPPAPKYARKKDLNQPEIVAALIQAGCSVWVLHTPVDLLVGHRGRVFLFEVKRPERQKRRTPEQRDFLATWRGQCDVITTAEEALRIMGALQ